MKALVLCEASGIWSRELYRRGYDVLQVDLCMPGVKLGERVESVPEFVRYCGDVRSVSGVGFDVVCAFPPCTDLACSGALHWAAKALRGDVLSALALLTYCAAIAAAAPFGLVENPMGLASRVLGKASRVVQPWQFATSAEEHVQKRTNLWLTGWPWVPGYTGAINRPCSFIDRLPPAADRSAVRSRSWVGMASAFVACLPKGGRDGF